MGSLLLRACNISLFSIVVALGLAACKADLRQLAQERSSPSAATPAAAADWRGLKFNLATYARQKPELSALAAMAAPGDSQLNLGSPERFQVQTNATAEGTVLPGQPPQMSFAVWVNALAFGKDLGEGKKMVEVQAQVRSRPIAIRGIVRYRGQEKFNRELTSAWNQTFTRSMATDAVFPTPMPGLGVKFGANVGGEFGGKIDPAVRDGESLGVAFVPRIAFSAGVSGGVTSPIFSEAVAFGSVIIVETQMSHFASVTHHPILGIAAGTLGVEDGTMKWLTGSVGIRAKLGADQSALPAGVNAALWHLVTNQSAGPNQSWEHVLWAPEPIAISRLPSYAGFMEQFLNAPKNRSECMARVDEFRPHLDTVKQAIDAAIARLEQEKEKSKSNRLQDEIHATAMTKNSYEHVLKVMTAECAAL